MVCPHCHGDVSNLAKHYGSNECRTLLGAFGEIRKPSEYAPTGGRFRKVMCECGKKAIKAGRCGACYQANRRRLTANWRAKQY